jgi:chromosome segregation ATPase
MSGTSIIGAIPGVVELISSSVTLIQQCASNTKLSDAHRGAGLQLQTLQDLLNNLAGRYKNDIRSPLSADEVRNVDHCLGELRAELASLNTTLESVARANKKGERRVFRRLSLVISGYENKLEEQFRRIEAIKSLLTLTLANRIEGHIERHIEQCTPRTIHPRPASPYTDLVFLQ